MPRFIATKPLFIGRARAANPGDEVPEENVKKHGWDDGVKKVADPKPAEKPEKA